ncbi:MAG: HypC/HybG/HupF family hydrogenase formation chaperone [Gammaproteobacteria bacterium SHHR-1]
MCLGIPMQIKSVGQFSAQCEAKGVEREVGLLMLQHEAFQPGDFVMVHLGQAMEKISREQALAAWELYDEIFAAAGEPNPVT